MQLTGMPLPRRINLALLVLYPIAWLAPLMQARAMWFLGGDQVSMLSGLGALWSSDKALAVLVALLAIIMPYGKVIATELSFTHRLPPRFGRALPWIARLSMADIFLIALYVVVAKGIAGASVTPLWGLWLFTICVLTSLWLSTVKHDDF
ncbi:Paraquat-inducible protein A [Monaibacterium marinum]|uniref:Paraquat-inducible protein A n=1 Tax=Pontivivens marinum TaxID=1690039 RepID=A0A2C9CT04_9RHOB|nr:paraquat-inducible protein A [Monaibacterium marinum]SOH94454.1 Paraquat-inducible protein A [Monaibacterium marinum]